MAFETVTRQLSTCRVKIERGGQKEGSGNIHTVVMRSRNVELCSFTSAILHHEGTWRRDEQTLTAVSLSPLSTLKHARQSQYTPMYDKDAPLESWIVDAAGSMPAKMPRYRTSD